MTTSPGRTRSGPSSSVGLDHAGGRARQVEVVRAKMAGVLGRLAADQRAAGLDAARGDPAHDRRDALGPHLPADDVVGHEQRLGPAHDEVIDDHADQVDADRVVAAQPLGDHDLGAHAVGRGGQQRPAEAAQTGGVEQAGEPADAAHHLGPGVRATAARIRSTARSPASMSTPAAA